MVCVILKLIYNFPEKANALHFSTEVPYSALGVHYTPHYTTWDLK